MTTLPVKTQEFELKKATGLRKGAVESVVLVSDELDSPRRATVKFPKSISNNILDNNNIKSSSFIYH